MKSIKSLSLLFVFVLFCCGAKLVSSCTQDEFDKQAKACLMNEFFKSIKEKPKQDCSAAYTSMVNCINSVFYGCKNSTDPKTLTEIASRARAVIGSEDYFCKDGMLNSFKGVNLQSDCRKKATKKVRNCAASFHKEFSEDKASPSLCRKYTKAKSCVKKVLEKFCSKTEGTRYILKIFQDPFNPYCPGSVDRRKSSVPRSAPNPFGTCSEREYFILTRVCMRRFIQTLQENPKKPCRAVFTTKLHNCAKEMALHCSKNESSYVKQSIERSFARKRAFQQLKFCDGINFQLSYPSLKDNNCKETFLLEKHKCEKDYVKSYKTNKADKTLCRKYAEAKRCAKNATLTLCKNTPQLRDEVNFLYDRFNPFCVYLSDPPARPGERLPRESGTRRPPKASTVPFIRRRDSISSASQSITAKFFSFVAPLCLLFSFF